MNTLATFVGNAWGSNLISKMSVNCIMTAAQLSWYGTGETLVHGLAAFSLPGVKNANITPANVAAGVSWSVGIGYRGGHPRNYICGVDTGDLTNVQMLTPTFASSLAAGAATFRTNVNGYSTSPFTSITLGTLSFVRNKLWREPPVFVPYTGASVDRRIDTLRHRLGPDIA